MNGFFVVAILLMAIVAIGFVALPLLKNKQKTAFAAVVTAVPVLVAGMYLNLGSADATNDSGPEGQARNVTSNRSGSANDEKLGSVASMLNGLTSRLKENPNDGGSWLLLARSYLYLDRNNEALEAYTHATALGQFNAELDALSGSGAISEPTGPQIVGHVELSADARDIVRATDTVFIFAKAVNGPPAPVAVLQRPASDLPIDFQLNDSQSMVAGMNLSSFDEVVVTARITRDGDATAALQGLEAKSETIRLADNRHLSLTIK